MNKTGAPTTGPAAVIVLAAGAGTRMKSTKPKVLHEVVGMALIDHVLHAAAPPDVAPLGAGFLLAAAWA